MNASQFQWALHLLRHKAKEEHDQLLMDLVLDAEAMLACRPTAIPAHEVVQAIEREARKIR